VDSHKDDKYAKEKNEQRIVEQLLFWRESLDLRAHQGGEARDVAGLLPVVPLRGRLRRRSTIFIWGLASDVGNGIVLRGHGSDKRAVAPALRELG